VVAVLATTFNIAPVVTMVPEEVRVRALPVVRPLAVMTAMVPVVALFAVKVASPVQFRQGSLPNHYCCRDFYGQQFLVLFLAE
jgi:hypothetical protein